MWKHVFHLNTSVETGFSLHKRLKEGGPCLTSFPGRFPEKMEVVGTALLQYLYLYLTLSVCSHFDWEIAGKNLCVPHSQQDWWKSSKPARCTYNMQPDLLGSFLAEVSPATSGRFGWGHRTKFRPSVGVEGGIETWVWPKGEFIPSGGGEVSGKKLMPDILHIKSQQTPTVIFFQATLSIFGHITSSKLPSSKNWPEEHIFF